MMLRNLCVTVIVILAVCTLDNSSSAQANKPLTNADIVAMVHKKVPESVIVSAIRSRPGKFNTSTDEIIRLTKEGVTENELNAMIAASGQGSAPVAAAAGSTAAPPADAAATMPASKTHMPKAYLLDAGALKELPLEKTQLATTKTKPSSMKSLAADSAVTQGMQSGINTATYTAATRINSGIGSESVQQAGTIFGGMMGHRTPAVTYVWGVPNPASPNVLQSVSPSFSVDFSRVMGIKFDDYEPTIVKLTPAQNTCRIVGATQGKEDARSSPAADWQIYSHFLEERVATKNQKMAPGQYRFSGASPLPPGEYAVVLRPIVKTKTFSGGDVARSQGDGLMFDAAWTFQISESAE